MGNGDGLMGDGDGLMGRRGRGRVNGATGTG